MSEFKIEIGKTFKDNKRNFTIIDREYKKIKGIVYKRYKYRCNKCGYECGEHWNQKEKTYKDEFWITESGILTKNAGCACCSNKIVVKGINDIATTHPYLVKYFVNIEDAYTHTYNSHERVKVKCENCNNNKDMIVSNLYAYGVCCNKCNDNISYSNKFMFNLLQQLNIDFKSEYSPKWIGDKRYDFYIPSKNLIIEMDGGFHKKDNNMNGQTAKESKEIDNYKDKLAKEHGIRVIRIDCDYDNIENRFEFIKNNIINSILNEMFNFNNINWIDVGKESEKSLLIKVCNYWKEHNNVNNENLSTTDLSIIFKKDRHVISRYLKRGTELGLCKYDPQKESINKYLKVSEINKTKSSKQVEIFKDGISLGKYPSARYLERISEEVFGTKLYNANISSVCIGKLKEYKGFTFKHI